jgi:hypothetical protein
VTAFIAAQRDEPGIPHATRLPSTWVSSAWFYTWRHGDASRQHARRARLGIEVGRLSAKHKGRYGAADHRRAAHHGPE